MGFNIYLAITVMIQFAGRKTTADFLIFLIPRTLGFALLGALFLMGYELLDWVSSYWIETSSAKY